MPELPEVETTKTSLAPLLGQQVIDIKVFEPKLRWAMPDDLSSLVDYTLDSVERRAKYLILKFLPTVLNDNDAMVAPLKLLIHLGMSGSLQQHSYGTDKRKHDHLIVVFRDSENAKSQLHYYDPRRFGSVLWYEDYGSKLLDHLGPEPLSEDFTAEYLYNVIQRNNLSDKDHNNTGSNKKPSTKRTQSIARAIKSVIMEQKVVVGVGNIYATESLYLSGIHPCYPSEPTFI